LPLMTEMEMEEDALMFEPEETYKHDNAAEKNSTFNCAVDSKDLDVPAFMRQQK